MKMRLESVFAALAIVVGIMAFAPGELAGDEPDAFAACSLIKDKRAAAAESIEQALARHSASGEAGRRLSRDCASALTCLLETRRLGNGKEPEGTAAGEIDASKLCKHVEWVGALSRTSIVRLTETVEPKSACRTFLDCLLRNAADPAENDASWKARFENICSQIEITESLAREKLEGLVRESDALLEELQTLRVPGARVYRFRLQKCRDFFRYTLELRDSGHVGEPE